MINLVKSKYHCYKNDPNKPFYQVAFVKFKFGTYIFQSQIPKLYTKEHYQEPQAIIWISK